MRAALCLVVSACWSNPSKPAPAPPVPQQATARTCNDAAIGLERGTKGVRAPDAELINPMRTRCVEDAWPATAIDCFAMMGEDELGHCAGMLDQADREQLFTALNGGSGYGDKTELALIKAKIAAMSTGIPECDNWVLSVGHILACEEMPMTVRIQLGNETADSWSLPTSGLSGDAIKKMAAICDQTRGQLEQRAAGAGCKL
ncbi:MAG: hypothetical protein H0V17_04355 [Deltaproteobacteria bacterium]|nr:hypothetical protein [Deltaproteobacteria bacterium]